MTLGEWLDRGINEYRIFTVRETTLDADKAMIKIRSSSISETELCRHCPRRRYKNSITQSKKYGRVRVDKLHGTELADSLVRKIHMMLHEALDMAVAQRLIIKNPTNGTTIPKNSYAPKQILNDEQLDRFMERIRQDEQWYDFFYTELTTGLRRGKICGLRWEDFNADTEKLKIRRAIHKKERRRTYCRRNQNRNRNTHGSSSAEYGRTSAKAKRNGSQRVDISEYLQAGRTGAPRLRLPPIKNAVKASRASADTLSRSQAYVCYSCVNKRCGCKKHCREF